MNPIPYLLVATVLFTMAGTSYAASVSDSNIFNSGTAGTPAMANSSSTFPGFNVSAIDDLSGDNQFFFSDNEMGATEILSLSNFNATAGIGTLRFYGQQEFEIRRVPLSVTIYTAFTNLTGAASLNESNYSLLGTFALPATTDVPNNHAYYTTGTDSTGGDGNYGKYDDLTNLGIATGTQSILFDFGPGTQGGRGLAEIQGFASIPEPSSYAMMLAGIILLGYVMHRKSVGLLV